MNPAEFHDSTETLGKPVDMTDDECLPLPIKRSFYLGKYPQIESVYELTDEDLILIQKSKRIRLKVVSAFMPPVLLEVESERKVIIVKEGTE